MIKERDKGYIWNFSHCECEYDKSCDIGEYLDYDSCKCRLIDRLVDECTETVEEVKPAIITFAENENSYKCSFCVMYTLLFWIFFTINIGVIDAFLFIFTGIPKKIHHMLTLMLTKKQRFTKHINWKN